MKQLIQTYEYTSQKPRSKWKIARQFKHYLLSDRVNEHWVYGISVNVTLSVQKTKNKNEYIVRMYGVYV